MMVADDQELVLRAVEQRLGDQAVHHMLTRELTLEWVAEAVPFDPMKYGGNPRVFGAAQVYQRWQ